jgi:hypothetical protein
MKERNIVKGIAGLLAVVLILAVGNTDVIYIAAAVLFFALCVGYAAWCERL